MSTIKVNKLEQRSGCTATVGGGAGKTVVVDATTVTLGRCGGTVALASGASQSGFGRTGTVDWQTGAIKTGNFTAVNGEGYFVNTAGGAVIMTMPSGSAGAIVSIQDYNKTFDSNSLQVAPASGEKINGGTASANLTIGTEGQGLTFVYVDATVGWKTVYENEFTGGGSDFIIATVSGAGNTLATAPDCANAKIATFTGPGIFCVSGAASPTNAVVSYMVIAGGGGGQRDGAGGGGAGGFREFKSPLTPYTASPLDGNPGGSQISITSTGAFPITVGAGGATAVGCNLASQGASSIFSSITSAGGGRAGGGPNSVGGPGGSGGGGRSNVNAAGGAGNTPPVSPPQGNSGGSTAPSSPPYNQWGGAGGGGAGGAGVNYPPSGAGGVGITTSINSTPTVRASGGSGGSNNPAAPAAGATPGGGGAGGSSPGGNGTAGTANTGGGGGSGACGGSPSVGGVGGSGLVIIRYKFQ